MSFKACILMCIGLVGCAWGCASRDTPTTIPTAVTPESRPALHPRMLVVRLAVFEAFPELWDRWFSGPRSAMLGIVVDARGDYECDDIVATLCSSTSYRTFRSHRELAVILAGHQDVVFAEGKLVNRRWTFQRWNYSPGCDWDPEWAKGYLLDGAELPSVYDLPIGDPLVGLPPSGPAVVCKLPAICPGDRLTIAWARGVGRAAPWGEPPDQFVSLLWKHADMIEPRDGADTESGWHELLVP